MSGGRALKLYSVSLWHLPIILELSLVTDITRWTRLIYPFFLSLGTHYLVEKVVQKLGSGDWCNYCRWNVAVSSNLGIYECTQSHTQTHRHTSIVTYQSSHICTPIEYKKFAWRPLIPVEFLRFVLVSFLSILEIPFSKNERRGSQHSYVFAEFMNPSAYKWSLLHKRVLLTIYAEPSLVLDFHTSLKLESMKQLASFPPNPQGYPSFHLGLWLSRQGCPFTHTHALPGDT